MDSVAVRRGVEGMKKEGGRERREKQNGERRGTKQ